MLGNSHSASVVREIFKRITISVNTQSMPYFATQHNMEGLCYVKTALHIKPLTKHGNHISSSNHVMCHSSMASLRQPAALCSLNPWGVPLTIPTHTLTSTSCTHSLPSCMAMKFGHMVSLHNLAESFRYVSIVTAHN